MKTAEEMIKSYSIMIQMKPHSSMLREVRFQYLDMAEGGNGGALGYTPEGYNHEPTCREYNYAGYPDSFFQEVCEGLGWS